MAGFTGNDGSELAGALNPSGAIKALTEDGSGNLNVNVQAGGTSGTQYTDGAATPTHPIGTTIVFDNAGTVTDVGSDAGLPVNIVAGSSAGTQYTDGNAPPANPVGNALMFDNAGTWKDVGTDQPLPVQLSSGANLLAIDASGRITLVPNSSVNAAQIGGATPQIDNSHELGVSLYGKQTNPGDTPLLVDASGRLYVNVNSLPALPAGSNLVGGIEVYDGGGVNKLAIDASGRLTLVPNSSVNLAQFGGQNTVLDNTSIPAFSMRGKGTVAGDTAPLLETLGVFAGAAITEDVIRNMILAGKAFTYSGGTTTGGAVSYTEFSLINPANSGKSIYIYRIFLTDGHGNDAFVVSYITTDPALTAATVQNKKLGGGTSSVASATYSGSAQTVTGTQMFHGTLASNNAPLEIIGTPGQGWLLPAGSSANGLAVFVNVGAAALWQVVIEGIEF